MSDFSEFIITLQIRMGDSPPGTVSSPERVLMLSALREIDMYL